MTSDASIAAMLYKFLPAKYALQALQESRVKVSRMNKLNDIYDCFPRVTGKGKFFEDDPKHAEEYVRRRAFEEYGMISYCGAVESLLLWSHYADSHRGIALGFDYGTGTFNQTSPTSLLRIAEPVVYADEPGAERASIDISKIAATAKIEKISGTRLMLNEGFRFKGAEWKYEDESREFVLLETCEMNGENYFMPFQCSMLKKVVLGADCEIDAATVAHSLRQGRQRGIWSEVTIQRASRNPTHLKVDLRTERSFIG